MLGAVLSCASLGVWCHSVWYHTGGLGPRNVVCQRAGVASLPALASGACWCETCPGARVRTGQAFPS